MRVPNTHSSCLLLLLFMTALAGPVSAAATSSAVQMYSNAMNAFRAGDYERAIELLAMVKQRLGETNPRVEALLAQTYMATGNFIEAKIAYEKLLKLAPALADGPEAPSWLRFLSAQIDAGLAREQENFRLAREAEREARSRAAEVALAVWSDAEEERRQKLVSQPKGADWFLEKAESVGTVEAYRQVADQFEDSQAGRLLALRDQPLGIRVESRAGHDGVVVSEIGLGPARRSGLVAGDVILKLNRQSVSDVAHFEALVAGLDPNQIATVVIERGGQQAFLVLR